MEAKKRVTFDDIAKYTNFSKTTISRYFNDPASLTEKSQQIISDALEKPLKLYAKRDAPFLRDRVEMCIRVQRKKLGV